MKYLHLAYDSPFFDKFIGKIPADTLKDHTFAVIGKNLKHIRSSVKNFERLNDAFWAHVGDTKQYDAIYLHFLGKASIKFVNQVSHPGFVWIFWGADGYKLPKVDAKLYLPLTQAHLGGGSSDKQRKSGVLNAMRGWWDDVVFDLSSARALKRIQYCATWIREDFELIRDSYNPDIKWIDFSYLNEDELFRAEAKSLESAEVRSGMRIMAGNSANPTNNHLDIFDYLVRNKICKPDTIVYCPLSYSGKQSYIDAVVAKGRSLFGDNFIPLTDFMPYADYLKLLSEIDVFFFFHRRQQAVNNSLSAKWLGKTIVLHPDNNLYKTFCRWGIHILSASDVFQYNGVTDGKVIASERAVLTNRFSTARIEQDYTDFFTLRHSE